MKKLSIGSFTLAVILSVVSILLPYGASNAGELLDTSSTFRQASGIDTSPAMFFALNKMNTLEKQAGVMPMTDVRLASIEGEALVVAIQVGVIPQTIVVAASDNVNLAINSATIDQRVSTVFSRNR